MWKMYCLDKKKLKNELFGKLEIFNVEDMRFGFILKHRLLSWGEEEGRWGLADNAGEICDVVENLQIKWWQILKNSDAFI